MTRKILLLTAVLMLLSGSALAAEDEWEATITFSMGYEYIRLTIGQHPAGTDGYDGRIDTRALLKGPVQAYVKAGGGQKLWRDMKSTLQVTPSWTMVVMADEVNQVVRLTWNRGQMPARKNVVLKDITTGKTISMVSNDSYDYINTGQRAFTVTVGKY